MLAFSRIYSKKLIKTIHLNNLVYAHYTMSFGRKNKVRTAARKQMKGPNAKCKRLGLHGKRVGYHQLSRALKTSDQTYLYMLKTAN